MDLDKLQEGRSIVELAIQRRGGEQREGEWIGKLSLKPIVKLLGAYGGLFSTLGGGGNLSAQTGPQIKRNYYFQPDVIEW